MTSEDWRGRDRRRRRARTVAQAMVGHTSLSGIQRTPSLPENEHVTMRIAAAAGLLVQKHEGSAER